MIHRSHGLVLTPVKESRFGLQYSRKQKQMHKDTFLFVYFEQTVVQVSDNIHLLGTKVAFCPLATVGFLSPPGDWHIWVNTAERALAFCANLALTPIASGLQLKVCWCNLLL